MLQFRCCGVRPKKEMGPPLKQAEVKVHRSPTIGGSDAESDSIGAELSREMSASPPNDADSDDDMDHDVLMELQQVELKSKTSKQNTPEEEAVSFPRRFSSAGAADEEPSSPSFYSRLISATTQQEAEGSASFQLNHSQLSLPQSPMRGRKRTTSGSRLSRDRSFPSVDHEVAATPPPSPPEHAPSAFADTMPPAPALPAAMGVT